jgi:hypothetical protein
MMTGICSSHYDNKAMLVTLQHYYVPCVATFEFVCEITMLGYVYHMTRLAHVPHITERKFMPCILRKSKKMFPLSQRYEL